MHLFIKLPEFNNGDFINDVMQCKSILKIPILKIFKDIALLSPIYDWD